MRFLAFVLLLLSQPAHAFETGFNQGWIRNSYGTQWGQNFDEAEFARTMDLTRAAGGTLLRYWLFEGFVSDAIEWKDGAPERLSPRFLGNLRKVLLLAKRKGVRLNLTLLDGNMGKMRGPNQQSTWWWWNMLNEKHGAREQFRERVWKPLLIVLSDPEMEGAVAQLDLVNEINALVRRASPTRFEGGWHAANRFVCELRRDRDAVVPGRLPLTASLGWDRAADLLLNGSLYPGCVDYFDVHVYDNAGEIPRCTEIVRLARRHGKAVQLGEFGQARSRVSDSIQARATEGFLRNARSCGMSAALAWRLAEPEGSAYLSFERHGRLRPAYDTFRRESQGGK